MRKAVKQIGVLALALLVFCLVCRLTVSRDYTIYVPLCVLCDNAQSILQA